MKRTLVLSALLAAVALAAGSWHYQRIQAGRWMPPQEAAVLQPAPDAPEPRATTMGAAPAPAPAAAGPEAEHKVEEVEPADQEGAIERILPRRSAGHAAGLHKTQDPLGLDSSAAMVVDANTRQVVFAKNEEAVLPMASITKLMTGLLIAESRLPMNAFITITEDDVDTERHSRSRLRVGTVLTRDEALRLALMSSENRAAHALGRTWPQGLAAFVQAMNARAQQLGMTNTTYADPTGLSSRNRSSARDLTALAVAASRYPVLREYSTTRNHMFQAAERRTLMYTNSNRLVKSAFWDIDLQKTGYIVEAGHCVVMRTRVNQRDLVMVLMDANDNASRAADADRIRYWLDPGAQAAERAIKAHEAKAAKAKKKSSRKARRVSKSFG